MASGGNNNKNYFSEEEDDDDDNVTIAEPESNTRNFVTQFIASAAQIDIERENNSQIAQDIKKKTAPANSNDHPIGCDLRRIADEIDKSYGPMFEDLVTKAVKEKIIYDVRNGYQYFVEITSSLFESGITLGRIFALLMFGYRWIVRSLSLTSNVGNPLITIINYLVQFLNSRVFQNFIGSMGGWSAVMQTLSSRATMIFAAFVGVFVFFAVMYTK